MMAPDDGNSIVGVKTPGNKKSRRVLFNTSVSVFTPSRDELGPQSDGEESDGERSLSPVITPNFNKTGVQQRSGDFSNHSNSNCKISSPLGQLLGTESDDQSNSPSPAIIGKYLRKNNKKIVLTESDVEPKIDAVLKNETHDKGDVCQREENSEHAGNSGIQPQEETGTAVASLNWSNDSIGEQMLDIDVCSGATSMHDPDKDTKTSKLAERDAKLTCKVDSKEIPNSNVRPSLSNLTGQFNIANYSTEAQDAKMKANSENITESNSVSGFQTVGSGKVIKVSAAALELARKKLFDDDDGSTASPRAGGLMSVPPRDANSGFAMMSGFKTAGGKNVAIVKESSITRSNVIIQSVDKMKEESYSNETACKTVSYSTSKESFARSWSDASLEQTDGATLSGFKTAKGSSVVIKADSIARSAKIMEDVDTVTLDRRGVDEKSSRPHREVIVSCNTTSSFVTPWAEKRRKGEKAEVVDSSSLTTPRQAIAVTDKTPYLDIKRTSFKTPLETKKDAELLTFDPLYKATRIEETPIRNNPTSSCWNNTSHVGGPLHSESLCKPSPNGAISLSVANKGSNRTLLSNSKQFKPVVPRSAKACDCRTFEATSVQNFSRYCNASSTGQPKFKFNERILSSRYHSARNVQFKSPMVAMDNYTTPVPNNCLVNYSSVGKTEKSGISLTRTPLTISKDHANDYHELCSEQVNKSRAAQLKAAREGKLGLMYCFKISLYPLTSKLRNLSELKTSKFPDKFPVTKHLDVKYYSFQSDKFVLSPEEFKFQIARFFAPGDIEKGRALIGDKAEIELNDQSGLVSVHDFHRALLTCSGVSKSVATFEWVLNAYRWIIWKLAAYAVCFPDNLDQTSFRLLSPDWVMFQLRYRFDKEYQMGQRSALRRIIEHDDTPMKLMVLFVSRINPTSPPYMEVSDGWYCILCDIDQAIRELIFSGKIKLGKKIAVCGSQLINAPHPTGPLEMSESVRLKISYNGCRPAKWDAKLGFVKDILTTSIGSVRVDGGSIPWMRIVIQRVYPKHYTEYLQNGNVVNMTQRQYTREIGKRRDEWESKRQTRNGATDDAFDDIDNNDDSRPELNVKATLKIRITDVEKPDKSALLNVYRIDENLLDELKEGRDLLVCNVKPIKHYPRENPDALILSSTNLTQFIPLSKKSRESVFPRFISRRPIQSFSDSSIKSRFDEFDIVGMVVRVNEPDKASAVFICDHDSKIALVQFPQGLVFLALEKVITIKSVLKFKNLKLMRSGNSSYANNILRFEYSLEISDVQPCSVDEVTHIASTNPTAIVSEAQKAAHQYIKGTGISTLHPRANLTRSTNQNDANLASRKRPHTSVGLTHGGGGGGEMTYEKRVALLRRHPSPQKEPKATLLTVSVNKGAKAEYKRPF